MTPAELAALDKAATQGEWRVEDGEALIWGACDPEGQFPWDMGYSIVQARSVSPLVGRERKPAADECDANAAFIVALVNGYRRGELVWRDEGWPNNDKLNELAAAATASSREMAMELACRIGVKRLIEIWEKHQTDLQAWAKAADEIRLAELDRLRAERDRLLEALEPLGEIARYRASDAPEWRDGDTVTEALTIGQLRRARAALGEADNG